MVIVMTKKKLYVIAASILLIVVGILIFGNKNSIKGNWKISDAEISFYVGKYHYKVEGCTFEFKSNNIVIKDPYGETFDTASYKKQGDVLMIEQKKDLGSDYCKYTYELKGNTLILHNLDYGSDYGYITFTK